ncbi:hypothetical protein P692DRAFT_201860280 [Suillus brevipes Sb2]|nr:hypothetical protein P692DRAFT_201860280 [Suillus brevipes Sb2]
MSLYWCVCRRHGGRRVQVKRSTYYDHIGEAATEEECERIINAQDDPKAIQLIREFLNKRHASPGHTPPRSPEVIIKSFSMNLVDNLRYRTIRISTSIPNLQTTLRIFQTTPPHIPNPPHIPDNPPQPQIQNPPDLDIDELEGLAQLPKQREALAFIQALRAASLDDPVAKLTPEALEKLRNPPQQPPRIESPIIRHGIEMYFHLEHAAQAAYKGITDSAARSFPGAEDIPTYHGVERLVAELSGIDSVKHHMCLNMCIAFTGPFADLEQCPFCDSHRYDQLKLEATGKQVPAREFHTIPLGPQLQALWHDPESAENMRYRRERTAAILQHLQQHNGKLDAVDDFICGSNYLDAVMQGRINENNMVLMISMDGAQLYRSKISDCWIVIWIILDHHPSRHYKKQYVLPGFHHLASLQNEGLCIWDASRDIHVTSHPFLALPTADALGLVHFDGMVGHSGRNGCRVYCGLIGRRKPQGSHYFPVLLKPLNYTVRGCSHDDIDVFNLPANGSESYPVNLRHLVSSPNQTQFEKRRTETGIVKPSLLLGLNISVFPSFETEGGMKLLFLSVIPEIQESSSAGFVYLGWFHHLYFRQPVGTYFSHYFV